MDKYIKDLIEYIGVLKETENELKFWVLKNIVRRLELFQILDPAYQ